MTYFTLFIFNLKDTLGCVLYVGCCDWQVLFGRTVEGSQITDGFAALHPAVDDAVELVDESFEVLCRMEVDAPVTRPSLSSIPTAKMKTINQDTHTHTMNK